MRFDEPEIAIIEAALARTRPGGWRRAFDGEIGAASSLQLKGAWRLDYPKAKHSHPSLDHLFIGIDQAFPWSEPRVIAPQADADDCIPWPHVESDGLLCLLTTRYEADAGERVIDTLNDAHDLFGWSPAKRKLEFQREFRSYWQKHATPTARSGISLIAPDGSDRDIVYWQSSKGRIVFADDVESLSAWIRNTGQEPPRSLPTTRLTWLVDVPAPDQYPTDGGSMFDLVGQDVLAPHLVPGVPLSVLLGIRTESGPIFAGVTLTGVREKQLKQGFRNIHRVPRHIVVGSFRNFPVARFGIERADPTWVHGRDHNPESTVLRGKTLGLIGCGALGGFLTRLVVQAGVGRLVLVDMDSITPHNTSRHVLGAGTTAENKALALGRALERDFPHLHRVQAEPASFECLKPAALDALAHVDLLISAGLGLETDVLIQAWREAQKEPSPWLCTWTEEFALAGHAVALFGTDRLMDGFDSSGLPRQRLTSAWPAGVATRAEAGCGNSFQPYGAVDLQGTVTLASRLALDVLLERINATTSRMWLGDRARVVALGGTPSPVFDQNFCERTTEWSP